MKTKLLFLSSLLLTGFAFGQAITINAADIPIPTAPFNLMDITTSNPATPTMGATQTWDYSSYSSSTMLTNDYVTETDPYFTNTGVDVYFNAFKNLTANLGYDISYELDFNANKVEDKGLYVYSQGYTVGNLTGNNADSITFPAQGYNSVPARTIMQFPYTLNSAWHSTSRRSVDFNLTVTAYGLNKTPGKQAYYFVENDSVAGAGTMRVYTANGPSIPYPVLMVRGQQYALDSFYLGGAPAPAPLLTAFGVTQGQKTGERNYYNFYKKGSFNYLLRLNYGTDATYTNLVSAYVSTDNITTSLDAPIASYSTIVYPNPTNGNRLNVQILGRETQLTHYMIIDMLGRTVQEGNPELNGNGNVSIVLDDNLVNGAYLVKIQGTNNEEVVKEKFDIIR